MDNYQKLVESAKALNAKYPNGNDPFQIISRLCEEAGELAKEVNHFEGTGIKNEKYGEPDREHLAGEVKNVIWAALQVVEYYSLHTEFEESLNRSWQKLTQ